MPDYGTTNSQRLQENFGRRFDAVVMDGETQLPNPWYSPVQIAFAADTKSRYNRWASYAASVTMQVKQVLNTEGVPIVHYAAYQAYGMEMAHAVYDHLSGTGLQLDALVLLNKWVARGLTQSVLEAIRLQVFNVTAPVEGGE